MGPPTLATGIPTLKPSTTTGIPNAPTFEYKSAYTDASYKFEAKGYGTVPGQSLPTIPTLPVANPTSYQLPTLPNADKKPTFVMPSTTRN